MSILAGYSNNLPKMITRFCGLTSVHKVAHQLLLSISEHIQQLCSPSVWRKEHLIGKTAEELSLSKLNQLDFGLFSWPNLDNCMVQAELTVHLFFYALLVCDLCPGLDNLESEYYCEKGNLRRKMALNSDVLWNYAYLPNLHISNPRIHHML